MISRGCRVNAERCSDVDACYAGLWHVVTMTSVSPATPPLAAVFDEVSRLKSRLGTLFAEAGGASPLSALESTVLTAVLEARRPPTVPQIGRSLGHHRQAVQRAARALCDAGLLVTVANPDHKKAHLLRPTDTGIALYEQRRADAQASTRAVMERLDAAACLRLADALRHLRGQIEDYLRARG